MTPVYTASHVGAARQAARTVGREGIGNVQIPDFIGNSHPKTFQVLNHYLRTVVNEELDELPNSTDFWEEAARLRLEGAGFSDDETLVSGPIFEVEDADALAALERALEGRLRILVFEDGS